jgi:integrase
MSQNDDEKRNVKNSEDDDEDESEGLVLPKILVYDEIDLFLLAIEDLEDLIAMRLMLFSGLRVGEAAAVQVKDINAETHSVFVRQGKGSKDRYAPLDVGTIALCQCYESSRKLKPDEYLFDMTKRTLQNRVTQTAIKAGLSYVNDLGKQVTWVHAHTLRHTCATWQLDKGIPLPMVQNNMGHSSIEVTQIYLHLNIRQRSQKYSDATRFGI